MQTSRLKPSEHHPSRGFKGIERLLMPAPSFNFHSNDSTTRPLIKSYIAEQFKSIHGAIIHDFMPRFLSMSCQGNFCAVSGIRAATDQPLFLEQYLPLSIETQLSNSASKPVARQLIVEIGNLVSTQRGATQLLFLILTAILQACPFEWVVFTATPPVSKMMRRMGMQLYTLAEANPALLTNTRLSDWGSYYDNQPEVVAVNISQAMNNLAQRTIYSNIVALYQQQINSLIPVISSRSVGNDQHTLSA